MKNDAISQALQQLGTIPISQPSAQLQPFSVVSPLPSQNIIGQALNILNPSPPARSEAQGVNPSPTPQTNQWGFRSDIDSKIRAAFPNDASTAAAIAMQESSYNPHASNPINSAVQGLFQIDVNAHKDIIPGKTIEEKTKNLQDPNINISVAKQIQSKEGWKPWQAYTSGEYKKYLGK